MPFPHRKLGIIIPKFFRAFNEQFRVTLFLLALKSWAKMIAVQRRFGLRGKVVGYHGIQSFREGEVTPHKRQGSPKAFAYKLKMEALSYLGDKEQYAVLQKQYDTYNSISYVINYYYPYGYLLC